MDTTYSCLSPDAEHFITFTMPPQLGIGYKLYHYSGSILAQVNTPCGQELREVAKHRRKVSRKIC